MEIARDLMWAAFLVMGGFVAWQAGLIARGLALAWRDRQRARRWEREEAAWLEARRVKASPGREMTSKPGKWLPPGRLARPGALKGDSRNR